LPSWCKQLEWPKCGYRQCPPKCRISLNNGTMPHILKNWPKFSDPNFELYIEFLDWPKRQTMFQKHVSRGSWKPNFIIQSFCRVITYY
jgi:hypothetical protein